MISKEEAIEWALEKHGRLVLVIPTATESPWSTHGPETVCRGCLQIFVGEYLSDIPDVFAVAEESNNEVGRF